MNELQKLPHQAALPEGSEGYSNPPGDLCEIRFRNYRLLPGARLLLKERTQVAIGSRAFDILHVLLRSPGRIVGKREIVDAAWPTTIVEESNLRFQVAQLRRALGDDQDLIKTVPGRGYLCALEDAPQGAPAGTTPAERRIDMLELKRSATHGVAMVRKESGSVARSSVCPEAQVLLLQFLDAIGINDEAPVILYVRCAR